MLNSREIIRRLWDAQGYGNLAIWEDGRTEVISPGSTPEKAGKKPLVVLKPISLVSEFSMVDFAVHDGALLEKIEAAVREAGGEIERG